MYLDFRTYSLEVVKLCMDMMYAVNTRSLGVNDILQLISFLIDAGYFSSCRITKQFFQPVSILIETSGHYGSEYPWHTQTVNSLAHSIEALAECMPKDQKIEIALVLAKMTSNSDSGIERTIQALQVGK